MAGSGRRGVRSILENTSLKRTSYLGTLVTIFTEVLLPLATALLPERIPHVVADEALLCRHCDFHSAKDTGASSPRASPGVE